MTSDAALQVLMVLLEARLGLKRDFWIDPVPARPPFIVRLASRLPVATLAALRASVAAIPDAVIC
jgi:hypothetical protein